MERSKIVEIKGQKFKLMIPTMRQRISIQSLVASLTRGNGSLMAFSGSSEQRKALELAETIAELDTLAIKMKEEGGEFKEDYSFSFQDIDADNEDLIEAVMKELRDFIDSFRKGS